MQPPSSIEPAAVTQPEGAGVRGPERAVRVAQQAVRVAQQAARSAEADAVRQWVERAQGGDVKAFEELYRRHVGQVYALCLRMTGEANEAEEMTQEAFVRAWEKLDGFHHRSAFGSWLHRLTVNVVLVRWRGRRRRRDRVVPFGDVSPVDGPELEELAPPEGHKTSPPGRSMDLERAISRLPTGARTVFVLHDIEGYRHRDIAEMTGLSVGTCKAQLHRARKLLRERLT